MSPQAGWILQEEIAPRIAAVVPRSIQTVGSEDTQELIADGVCMAARMIDRVERQGKLGKVSASNISYYTLQHLKSGRRAAGSSAVCVHGSMTQLNGGTELHSMSEVVSATDQGDEVFELHDVLSTDQVDPGMEAARRMDWDEFCTTLDSAELTLITCLVEGQGIKEAAKHAKVHYATMQNYRKKLALKILDFFGPAILKEILSVPFWRIGLDCERELLACHVNRRD